MCEIKPHIQFYDELEIVCARSSKIKLFSKVQGKEVKKNLIDLKRVFSQNQVPLSDS